MCGRARCTLRPEAVPAACGFQDPLKTVDSERCHPSYNVSPGSYMPVVRYNYQDSTKEPIVHCMKWGLVPSFTKKNEQPDHFRMFNARSESVREKASFRRLLPKCRCLAVVEGFYEWKKDGAKKQPFYIHFNDGRPLVFAALFDCWVNDEGGALHTFTILTTHCSDALEWLHDRMPVILGSKEAVDDWLNSDISELSLQRLTQPYEASDLVWYPVTPAMGKTSFDGPECIKEVKPNVENKNSISQLFSRQRSHLVQEHPKAIHNKHQGTCSEGPPEQDLIGGSILDEQELKAFLAAMEPDKDIMQKSQDEKPKQTDTKGKVHLKDKESSVKDTSTPEVLMDTCPQSLKEAKCMESEIPDVKDLKRKQPHEPPVSIKGAGTPPKGKQRTLLNFFEKQ